MFLLQSSSSDHGVVDKDLQAIGQYSIAKANIALLHFATRMLLSLLWYWFFTSHLVLSSYYTEEAWELPVLSSIGSAASELPYVPSQTTVLSGTWHTQIQYKSKRLSAAILVVCVFAQSVHTFFLAFQQPSS